MCVLLALCVDAFFLETVRERQRNGLCAACSINKGCFFISFLETVSERQRDGVCAACYVCGRCFFLVF